jgi:SAM-dependent methyltransferase
MRSLRERGLARTLADRLPAPAKSALKRVLVTSDRPRWGNLRRTRPFSHRYGFDRGTPVDRHYIADFIGTHSADVRGAVLEVQAPVYTLQFGGTAVTDSQIVDIDPRNEEATIIADLVESGSLPEARFDCFVLTQTLQVLPDVRAALDNVWRTLRPGGVLLVTVPSLSRIDRHIPQIDFWRFTPAGLERALEDACPGASLEVSGYGNLVTATAFLTGLAAEELRRDELELQDPDFPILACARVVKPSP